MSNNINREEYEDQLFYENLETDEVLVAKELKLPAIVEKWVDDATKASNYNDVPAAFAFFCILGQLCKDMVAIPSNMNIDDTRLHFLWMQTSGTGKSTLTNWIKPILKLLNETLNNKHGTDFNIFDVVEYTDAALIGSIANERQSVEDDDGNVRTVDVKVQIDGELEGHGLAMWDEFEYSGVFKQSQHKEQAVVYLNTFMNTLWGETWVITKKLKEGEIIVCHCKRSVYASTYIPKLLTQVISEKGVLQRMLIYIHEVPQWQQKLMRRRLIQDWGKIGELEQPKLNYAKNFVTIYETVKERYEEVDNDPLKVIRFSPNANDALERECELMERYIIDSRPEVFDVMGSFINRILKHIQKLSILCCIAEAPSITDKNKRFIVTQNNVLQASSLIRQCYKSLVTWLDESLRAERASIADKANIGIFKTVYRESKKNDEGWVNKNELLQKVREKTKKSESTIYKWFAKVEEYFDVEKINRTVYVRLSEDIE